MLINLSGKYSKRDNILLLNKCITWRVSQVIEKIILHTITEKETKNYACEKMDEYIEKHLFSDQSDSEIKFL